MSFNGKLIFAGGKRQAPIDIPASQSNGFTVYDFEQNYEQRLDGYFRMDMGISYRRNRKNITSVISLDIQNVTQRDNEFFRFYNNGTNSIESDSQVSFFPNLSYRIEF